MKKVKEKALQEEYVENENLDDEYLRFSKVRFEERSDEFTELCQKKINRILGQLGGVKLMLDNKRYCSDILVQLLASERAIQALAAEIFEDHFNNYVKQKLIEGNENIMKETIHTIKKLL